MADPTKTRRAASIVIPDRQLRHLGLALEAIGDAATVVTPDNVVRHANSHCHRICGYEPRELIGRPITSLILSPEATAGVDEQWEGEVIAVRGTGEQFFAHLTLTPVRGVSRAVVGRVLVLRDITERKALEARLAQAQKMELLGRLTGGMAHDFNNLLTPIISYAELAQGAVVRDSQLGGYLREIRRVGHRASKLAGQSLSFSSRPTLDPQIVNVNDLMLSMAGMLRRLISEDIELVALPDPDVGMVRIDPGQMEQVVINLALIAQDAMPDGGKLVFESGNTVVRPPATQRPSEPGPAEYVTLSVGDTGSGMSPEVKFRAFQPFFTTKEAGKGTGLGLSTCDWIVTQAGGHITVESSPGNGAVFEVHLPRVNQVPDLVDRLSEPDGLPGGDETVLLVEDEPSVRNVAGQVLRACGYRVLMAANGQEALGVSQAHAREQIHLLLTDVVMPLMGGRELAGRIGDTHPEARVLYASGYGDEATACSEEKPVSQAHFIQKPFTPSLLARKVREALEA